MLRRLFRACRHFRADTTFIAGLCLRHYAACHVTLDIAMLLFASLRFDVFQVIKKALPPRHIAMRFTRNVITTWLWR